MARDEEVLLVKKWMAWQFSRFIRGAEVEHNIKSFLDGPREARIPLRVDFMLTEDLRRVLDSGDTDAFVDFQSMSLDKS